MGHLFPVRGNSLLLRGEQVLNTLLKVLLQVKMQLTLIKDPQGKVLQILSRLFRALECKQTLLGVVLHLLLFHL